jgi:hypothetical protein
MRAGTGSMPVPYLMYVFREVRVVMRFRHAARGAACGCAAARYDGGPLGASSAQVCQPDLRYGRGYRYMALDFPDERA